MPRVCLAYSPAPREIFEQVLDVPAGASIADAVRRSDLAQRFPAFDWQAMTPGIWGKAASWSQRLAERDRIELCRDLKVDPKVARRERFKRQGARGTGLFANRRQGGKAGY